MSTMDTCKEHKFGRPGRADRTRGAIIVRICDVCLATEVTHILSVDGVSGAWDEIVKTTIVAEPAHDGSDADVREDKHGQSTEYLRSDELGEEDV